VVQDQAPDEVDRLVHTDPVAERLDYLALLEDVGLRQIGQWQARSSAPK
jgi:hypothetical protein